MNRRHFLSALAGTSLAGLLAPRASAAALLDLRPGIDADLDLSIIRAAMGIHPGLYRFQSPRAAERGLIAFEEAYRAAAAREDMAGAYLALSRYLTTLRCGHSYANFFNQDDTDVLALFAQKTRLPFWFRWMGNRMIVTRDTEGHGLVPGSEVESVNGQPLPICSPR